MLTREEREAVREKYRRETGKEPPVGCQRDGFRPGAFNVKVPCNLEFGHRGPCDHSGAWGRRGTWATER